VSFWLLQPIREEISSAVFAWNRWNFLRNFKRVSCKGNFEVRILRGQHLVHDDLTNAINRQLIAQMTQE
jgi:hypothetical protein